MAGAARPAPRRERADGGGMVRIPEQNQHLRSEAVGWARRAMVLVALVALAACQVPIEDRPPIIIDPTWNGVLRKDVPEHLLVSSWHSDTQKQTATANRVIGAFMAKNGIRQVSAKNIYIYLRIGNYTKDTSITVNVADAMYYIIPYLSDDATSKIQAVMVCGAHGVGRIDFWYSSSDPVNESFFYDCLDDLFSRGAACTQ